MERCRQSRRRRIANAALGRPNYVVLLPRNLMRMVRIVAWCAVVAGLIYLSGCAESPQPPPAQALKELGEVYKYLDYSKFPPPKNAAEFNQYQDAMMNAYQGVQNGDYVVAYGVGWSTAPGASSQVLAYEKK